MTARIFLAAIALNWAVMPTIALAATAPIATLSQASTTEIDRLSRSVTEALLAGDSKAAVDAFAAKSPLMADKTIEIGALQSQTQTALTAYGKIATIELAKQQVFGTSVVRRYFLARHENMITRWELVFAHTGKG